MRILDSEREKDRYEWCSIFDSYPDKEVFAHPSYVELFCRTYDRALCAVGSTENGGLLFPFILRPLASEPWTDSEEQSSDIVSPYGYGGPFKWGSVVDAETTKFWLEFEEWASQHNVVSAFVRMSLFDSQRFDPPWTVTLKAPNIVRYLGLTEDELWYDYEHKVRKNVKKAQRNQLKIRFDENGSRLDEFVEIYYSTMKRRDAAQNYYFDRNFFQRMVNNLRGQYIFCHVLANEQIVSTELVLVSQYNLYSFLGGTLTNAFANRPNELLKHEIALWGMRRRKTNFVLGGGYKGEDGIYKYKESFARNGIHRFHVAQSIFDEVASKRLIQKRQKYEAFRGSTWLPGSGFFPPYRAE